MLSGLLPEPVPDVGSHVGAASIDSWPTMLIVDPDQATMRTLVCFFEKRGFHVASATSIAEAQDYYYRRKNWALIIVDYHLSDGTGPEFSQWLHDRGCNSPLLLMTSSPYAATLCAGHDYLEKPFTLEKLEAYVRNVRRS